MKLICFIITLTALSACISAEKTIDLQQDYSTVPWQQVSPTRISKTIQQARKKNKNWVKVPSLFAQNLFEFSELKNYSIQYTANRGESPDQATIIVMRDGFLDDSVRGDIHHIELNKMDDDWQVSQVKRAHRCWRSEDKEFTTKPCP